MLLSVIVALVFRIACIVLTAVAVPKEAFADNWVSLIIAALLFLFGLFWIFDAIKHISSLCPAHKAGERRSTQDRARDAELLRSRRGHKERAGCRFGPRYSGAALVQADVGGKKGGDPAGF